MIEFFISLLRKRRAIATLPTTRTISELLKLSGRVADYLVEVREETQDTLKFGGNVADWVVKYIPPDYLATKGSVSEYGVKATIRDSVKPSGLVWTYGVSVINVERLDFSCYIKTYSS